MAYPKYDFNKYLRSALAKADYLKDLLDFVVPEIKDLSIATEIAQIERLRASLKQEKIDCDHNTVKKAYLNLPGADENLKQHVNGIVKCQKYVDQRLDDFSMSHLKKSHEILLRGTSMEKYGGILRNPESAQEENTQANYLLPESEQLNNLTSFLIRRLKPDAKGNHPLIKSLAVYLLFDIVQPFIVFNQSLSLIAFNQLLRHFGYDFQGLLTFEKYILQDQNTHNSIKLNSLFPLSAKERLETDLTAFFENSLSLLLESFAEIEENALILLKDSVNYANMKPIQKNSFNYLFHMGFEKNHAQISGLNDRQKSILRHVAFKRNVSTKEMVMKYRCDRKTIQRDFADLIEIGIIDQEGKTKTINYHLSFS